MPKNFEIVKETYLDELKATLIEGVHVKSGASFMHIANDDPENLFCLSLKTLPSDDKGAPHILEHTVLCGSKKFPIKDPFFAMHRRSLNTFMNAMTGVDFTCYPAASQVEKDFYNLFEVYLDAVFHPNLDRDSFLQEGHRLEVRDEKLVNKGIVFNEMKGALSSPDSRMWDAVCRNLLPDTPYRFNSGGIPKAIATLSYEELLKFHKTYYHPGRCLFFTYGNLPLEKHLEFIEKQLLKGVEKAAPIEPIPSQKRFEKPVTVEGFYPASDGADNKDMFVLAWLTVPIEDQETALALAILDSVLMDTDASPLKRHILDSKQCASADAYLDLEMRDIPYLIACRGCEKGDLEKVILEGLEKIAKDGIDPKLAKSALHQLELSRLEISGGHSPFGLTLFMRSALMKQHGCPPENGLAIYSIFEKLGKQIEDPQFLAGLINKHLLTNPHRLSLHFKPDPNLIQKEENEEQEVLKALDKTVDKPALIKQQEELEKLQKTKENENLDCLPKIGLSDVPKKIKLFPLKKSPIGGCTLYHHDTFTNHLVYANVSLELPEMNEEELLLSELMISLIPELGLGEMSFAEHLSFQHANTGGFSLYYALNTIYGKKGAFKPRVHLRGKALSRNREKLLGLFKKVLSGESRFDEKERIKELITQMATALKLRLARNSMSYAIGASLAPYSVTNTMHEELHGTHYYRYLQELAANLDKRMPLLLESFEMLKSKLFHNHSLDCVMTCDTADAVVDFSTCKKDHFVPFETERKVVNKGDFACAIPANVAFTSKAVKLDALPSLDSPALSLACRLFENKVLHKRIREEGGAYGSGATYHPLTGNFHMHAYRDPNIKRTLEAFNEAIEVIGSGGFSADDLFDAKLGLIQGFDTPVPPGARGNWSYSMLMCERTPERRQAFRDAVLGMEKAQIEKSVQTHLKSFSENGNLVCFAGDELLKKEAPDLERKSL